MLEDHYERLQATDPFRSFIVQAPAGSGKTELLTQRYLRLLSIVKAPEEIVALTFTRKAASEMRERIMGALEKVATGVIPSSPHQEKTFQYARAALKRSEQLGWSLIKQPGRLRIMTIDALCQLITHAIPLHENQIPYAQVTENPFTHYQAAARACFFYALSEESLQSALKNLLQHLDNRQDKLLDLLSQLLAKRDQWLPLLYLAQDQNKEKFESMLKIIEQHELERFKQSVPLECRIELYSLAKQVSYIEFDPKSPRYLLQEWSAFDKIDRSILRGLSSLLLTSTKKLRKGFDHHVGLKKNDRCEPALIKELKSRSQDLFRSLGQNEDFLETLLRTKDLPDPNYDSAQWIVLQALFTLLPILVGHLHLIFSENDEVDFTAISQQASLALGGNAEEPTDLSLYLDNKINHLLVDEFQDTSIPQFQLLTQLIQGWEVDEGRTLFLVGDPMQSIYRFRQAEVGLFLKTKREGIGPVQLESLELKCNFRSTTPLIDWVNTQFKTIFPSVEDVETGAVSFYPSKALIPAHDHTFVRAYQYANSLSETIGAVQVIERELKENPDNSIAILVRSRRQLASVIQLLREKQIAFQGVDIELLSTLPHLRDVWSLTQVLLSPANRLAWLALLRSPCVGLSLEDLHRVAQVNPKTSIYKTLSQLQMINNLTKEGQLRLQFVYHVIQNALNVRYQQSLVSWVEATLRQLHGDILFDNQEKADLERYWKLLERLSEHGLYLNLEQFKQEFEKLYAQHTNSALIQVMTIHKSKGLEFDTVILPHLGGKTQNKDKPLLRWLTLPREQNEVPLLLVSPIKAAHQDRCLLYDYLSKLEGEKELYELQRLLYVAVTRAKKRLYLLDHSHQESKNTFRSLLASQPFLTLEKSLVEISNEDGNLPIKRLTKAFYLETPTVQKVVLSSTQVNSPSYVRQIGIISHEILQWIGTYHPTAVDQIPWGLFKSRLVSLGLTGSELELVFKTLYEQITQFFADPIAQWFSQKHKAEQNEYALLIKEKNLPRTRIIDRTFISQGIRWIIDFKTGNEEERSVAAHRQQVNYYASLMSKLDMHPIYCGIYYLSTGHWLQWSYQEEMAVSETK